MDVKSKDEEDGLLVGEGIWLDLKWKRKLEESIAHGRI